MRRIIKKEDSPAKNLIYDAVNRTANNNLRKLLTKEQNNICAYTETYLDRTSSAPIEHFDPTLKGKERDGYENYFICKDQWNNEKGTTRRWLKYQPILHPNNEEFEDRVFYDEGSFSTEENDIEAEHLVEYLKLNDFGLVQHRSRYIKRKRKEIEIGTVDAQAFFDELLKEHPESVYFIRAIEEEFNVEIDFSLLSEA